MIRKCIGILVTCNTLALLGCASTPNSPSLTLHTGKSPAEYAQCVYPKWLAQKASTSLSQGRNKATIATGGTLASDQILEVHKLTSGSEVAVYWRGALATPFGHRGLESSARECL